MSRYKIANGSSFDNEIDANMEAAGRGDSMGAPLNAWIGARYAECGRVLVLLESTYGASDGRQRDDVLQWVSGGTDPGFSALHRACAVNSTDRLEFFNRVACMNLAVATAGATNQDKAKAAQLRGGAATLPERLRILAPRVVWIASTAAHKTPGVLDAVRACSARPVPSVHPASWHGPHAALAAAWAECGAFP